MNSFLDPPALVLLKWTILLALGWVAHWLLQEQHARWRLTLWRSLLCLSLAVPLTVLLPVPAFRIPVYKIPPLPGRVAELTPTDHLGGSRPDSRPLSVDVPAGPPDGLAPAKNREVQPSQAAAKAVPWTALLLTVWSLGAVLGFLRLVRLQRQLSRIRRDTRLAESSLQEMARQIQNKMGVANTLDLRVADEVSSPFACGLFRPMIVLPRAMAQDLAPDELSALLAHEIAHFRRHDLFWCLGWRWTQAAFWFHPLVWRIPEVHGLACEQEADQIASGQLEDKALYPRLLARLILRVHALPEVETRLVLNGTSRVARRLRHLQHGGAGVWNWRKSAAGFGLAAALFVLATACGPSSPANGASAKVGAEPAHVASRRVADGERTASEDGRSLVINFSMSSTTTWMTGKRVDVDSHAGMSCIVGLNSWGMRGMFGTNNAIESLYCDGTNVVESIETLEKSLSAAFLQRYHLSVKTTGRTNSGRQSSGRHDSSDRYSGAASTGWTGG